MQKLLSVANMKKSDNYTCEKVTAVKLMSLAGHEIFESGKMHGNAWTTPVAVVCGVGNNAGDGFAVAELLAREQLDCTIFMLTDRVSDTSRPFYEKCKELGIPIRRGIDEMQLYGFATVLDCLLGIGLTGELREPFYSAIERINSVGENGAYIISTDINSGLGADSGLPCPIAVKSDLTVSVGQYKSGHFLGDAKDFIKSKINREIGIEPLDKPAYLIEKADIRRFFVRERANVNKGDFGYVALIGGCREYSGAAKLANLALNELSNQSLAALRSGAGVAKLAVPACIANAVLPYLLESTLFELTDSDGKYRFERDNIDRLLRGTKTAALGMGMGRSPELAGLLEYLLAGYDGRLIIDADGLNVLSELDRSLIKNAACRVILTPHPKEFERLSGIKIADFRHDIVSAAQDYAKETRAILLLKGASTVITDGDETYIVDRGCAGMSTAGSGDVLSGILAGICAPTSVADADLPLAVAAGAYLNGLAGELAEAEIGSVCMLSGDTVSHIPEAVRAILN